ncbi:MAG: type II CRISPR RNA-guided endonuclease Cas9, partial [Nitrospinales bacterium]
MAPQKYRLGLDLGTNSIGWVLLLLNAEGRPKAILRRGEYVPGMGSRIFSDGRDPKSKTSLAVNRRDKRSARRRRWRYKRRRKILMNLLIRLGLMPKNKKERKELASLNPYELRAKALDKPLAPFELGRALFHLDQRRGFQSNRKTTSKEETKKIDPEISGLKKSIKDSGARTLGEFLYWRNKEGAGVRARPGENLYPTRDMYKAEFDAIREQQAQHHPKLTEENWRELLDRIFYQRDLKPQQPGQCQFEPNELRAPRALPSAQKFLIAQDLTNLQWIDLDRKKHPMTEDQRKTLWGKLNSQKTLSFGGIRTALKLPKHIEFNLETDRRKELKGNQTAKLLSDKNYFGNAWRKLDDEQQDEIVEALLEIEEEEPIIKKAVNEWGLDEDRAKNLAKLGPDDF